MKHKLIITVLSTIVFSNSIITLTPTQPVNAATWYVHHYPYFVTHKVKINKNITFKKLKFGKHTYQDHIVTTKRLKRGSIIKVKKGGATYPWFVTGHGMTSTRHYAWICSNENSKWFKIID